MPAQPASPAPALGRGGFFLCLASLLVVLGALFHPSFAADQVHFANDGPLGAIGAQAELAWQNFRGYWQDLNWVGGQSPSGFPNFTNGSLALLGPVAFAKFYPPFTLLVLGLSAWLLFRQLRLSPVACVLGAIAAALNSDALSRTCWGVGGWVVAQSTCFLALAALVSPAIRQTWLKIALAGVAVGVGVMEGFDTGALHSVFIGVCALGVALAEPGETKSKAVRGVLRVALMAVVAAIVAAQAVTTLVGTQIKGIAGADKSSKSTQERWDFATQWSLPKAETLRIIIPGIFGYRMDTPEGGTYWGTAGRHPGWTPERPIGYPRHSGSGEYAGVLVALVALWGAAQSFRGKDSPFSDAEKRIIWFCCGAGLLALLLAWGRHAPFYRLFYELPYSSTVRSPLKFIHQFHVCLLALFAFGLDGLWRRHLVADATPEGSVIAHMKAWWRQAVGFDRRWAAGSVMAFGAALLGWLMFAASSQQLKAYLERNGFSAQADPGMAESITRFAVGEAGWFLLFFALSLGAVIVIMSGALAGRRARGAGVLLGLLLVTDLSRASSPWISYYNYRERYATNPVLEALRQDAPGHRVAILPFQLQDPQQGRLLGTLQAFHHNEWLQHHFPYYHIQSLDIAQEPRMPQEKIDYTRALQTVPLRYWQLTNTRFLLGLAGMEGGMNQQFDPVLRRFRAHTAFTLVQTNASAPVQTHVNTNGPFALLEFTGALPRAALYTHWQVNSDPTNTLATLANPAFDPARTVLVADALPAPAAAGTNAANEVRHAHYSPRHLRFQVKAEAPSVLLLNDRFDPSWQVTVDGQPRPLLRCNFIMRGVHLAPGEHTVEFRFQPPVTSFYVSLAALLAGLGLCLFVVIARPALAPAGSAPVATVPLPERAPDRPAKGRNRKAK